MNSSLIKRKEYLNQLFNFKDKDLIKVITGIRRCGKSTLFDLYCKELKKIGIKDEQIISINFEDPINENLLDSNMLYKTILQKIDAKKTYYIFFDEIQNVNNFQKAVDGLFLKKNCDIYITGSNAYLLSGELTTLLSGRYVEIKMHTFSFSEYIQSRSDKSELQRKYQEYIESSSFPYTINLQSKNEIRIYLEGIYNTVLIKDIVSRAAIKDVVLLQDIINFVFDSIGSPISATNIANTLTSKGRKTSFHTVENYLEALIKSYICYKVQRYDVKGKQLLSTQSKYYVADIGLRNFLLGTKRGDRGYILENIVFLELLRRGYKVYVGKSGDTEIDFVAQIDGEDEYYQVAYSVIDDVTLERELKPLDMLKNHNKKILLTMDWENVSYDGIKQMNVLEWLLGK